MIEAKNKEKVMKLSVPEKKSILHWHKSFGHQNFRETMEILKEKESIKEAECIECMTV